MPSEIVVEEEAEGWRCAFERDIGLEWWISMSGDEGDMTCTRRGTLCLGVESGE